MRQWYWGCIFSVIWKVEPTGIRVLAASPKLAFGLLVVNLAWVLNAPNFQRHPITITSTECSRRAAHTALHIYSSSPVPSENTLLLRPSSPSLPSTKKMSDNPIKFPSSEPSSEDDLSCHQSSEEDDSSDDWRASDYSPPWSSEKEDEEEDDEDDNDSDSDSPPPKRARRAWSSLREDHF